VAEAAGLARVWFAENPFDRGVLPAMVACALATRRLGLGVGVFNPYNRHPTLMAMEIAAFDEISHGRTILGIGSGVLLTDRMGLPTKQPISAMRDAVCIVRAMLQGETVTYEGKAFSARGAKLGNPGPRSDVPIFLAAVGAQGIRLCGELTDGLIISNMCPPAYTRWAVDLLHATATAAHRPPPSVVQYLPCAVHVDGAEARRLAKSAIGRMLPFYVRLSESFPAVLSALREYAGVEPADFDRAMIRLAQGESATDVLDDRFVRAYAVAGTVDECLEQFAGFRGAGASELAIWPVGDDPAGAITRLGTALGRHA
jgi:5,10-methylenetetrahydromethanopterin reductase